MTARWLTDEWFALVATEVAGIHGPPTLQGSVVVEVTGGATGDLAGHVAFADGGVVGSGAGPTDGPDLVLTLTDSDARAIVAGGLDPSVAFMQGRMKVVGAMAPLLDLLALAGTEDGRAGLGRVADQTEF